MGLIYDHRLNFGLEISLSVVVSALIFTVVKMVKIRYGDMVITHMTSRPYKIAVILFIFSILELLTYLIVTNVLSHNNYTKAGKMLIDSIWL